MTNDSDDNEEVNDANDMAAAFTIPSAIIEFS